MLLREEEVTSNPFAVLARWKFLYYIDRFDHIKANKSKLINNKIYWYDKYQYIEKKVSCWNKCSVFRSDIILKLCDVCFMKNIFIAPWTCLLHFDLHIIIRWPENVKRLKKICIHCGHFIHCYILLNVVSFFSSSWQSVTMYYIYHGSYELTYLNQRIRRMSWFK